MTYHSGRTKKTRAYINFALGLVAFLLFVYFWSELRSIVYPTVEPLVRGYGGTTSSLKMMPAFIASYFSSRNELITERSALERNIERLENAVAEKDAWIREREELVRGMPPTDDAAPVIVMYPLAQDVSRLYSTVLLSKGFKDGVGKGDMVHVRGLQPVCEVVEVYDHTSLCEFLSKGGREVEGVAASSTVTLFLKGNGGGSFIAETPKDVQVSVGEDVYLRGNPAYKLGTIVSIQDDQQATGAKIYIRGAYNPMTSSVFYLRTRYAP